MPVHIPQSFRVPLPKEYYDNVDESGRICVVGIFGVGSWGYLSKCQTVNKLIGIDAFLPIFPAETQADDEGSCFIDAYYDRRGNVMYLHLTSYLDAGHLAQLCEDILNSDLTEGDLHSLWRDHQYIHARSLIFMFSMCHIMLHIQPTVHLNTSYIRLFRALESVRQKLVPQLSSELAERGVNELWQRSGRLCTPRLLFVVRRCPLTSAELDPRNDTGGKKPTPMKRLTHNIEDQIYRILRKSRVLMNQCANCLFAVPANQAFVYVMPPHTVPTDPISILMNQLHVMCTTSTTDPFYRSTSACDISQNETNTEPTLKQFIEEHINLVLNGEGFDDNIRRLTIPYHFEIPSLTTWLSVCESLYDIVTGDSCMKAIPTVEVNISTLRNSLDPEMKFSEARCSKILPVAVRTYQENVPKHYTKTIHQKYLSQAVKLYSLSARGPAYEYYEEQVRTECLNYWKSGRQLCEERSLTGQHCIHQFHRLPDCVDITDDDTIPVMNHQSRSRITSSCNCGSNQSQRDDPFDCFTANHSFYLDLEESCCSVLEHYDFPSFKPSSPHAAPAIACSVDTQQGAVGLHSDTSGDKLPKDVPSTQTMALSLSQSALSMMLQDGSVAEGLSVGDPPKSNSTSKITKLPRQVSTTEYLSGMLSSDSPPGLLPKFPSWSLVRLGDSSSYVHSKGLELPGFIHGTNVLLQWQIHPDVEDKPSTTDMSPSAWPSPGEAIIPVTKKKSQTDTQKKVVKPVGIGANKAYIGVEYECMRGHRFLVAAPDKVMKASTHTQMKNNALKIIGSYLPLYFTCPSRTNKLHIAQLMRVYVVTPDDPTRIAIRPQVQPAPSPCPTFHPVADGEIALSPNSMWVMRFPFIYMSDGKAFSVPVDIQPSLATGKVVKGLIKLAENSDCTKA